jgi:hypothetical protein
MYKSKRDQFSIFIMVTSLMAIVIYVSNTTLIADVGDCGVPLEHRDGECDNYKFCVDTYDSCDPCLNLIACTNGKVGRYCKFTAVEAEGTCQGSTANGCLFCPSWLICAEGMSYEDDECDLEACACIRFWTDRCVDPNLPAGN